LPRDRIDMAPDAAATLQALELDTVQRVLDCQGDRVAALSRTSEIVQVTRLVDDEPCSVFIKRYRFGQWKRRLKLTFRGSLVGRSRARFERDMLTEMPRKGVPAVRLMAYGERRVFGFVETAFLITEAQQGSVSPDAFVRQCGPTGPAPAKRHALVRGLAKQVRHMHNAGVAHGGLVWRNILIRPANTHETDFAFHFLDPAPVRVKDPQAWAARGLAELGAMAKLLCTRTDVVRFVTAYLREHKPDAACRARLADIDARAATLVEQERHRLAVRDAIAAFEDNWVGPPA